MNKQALLIVGMHRSGTSALSGVINIMGAYMGENMMSSAPDNPKGFYENSDIVRFNEYVLHKIGSSWDDVKDIEVPQDEHIVCILQYIIETVFVKNPFFIAIKDPRLCLLLPIYQRALSNLGYDVHCIRALRDWDEVAESLRVRDKFSIEKSKRLCEKYNQYLEKYLPPKYVIVNFDDLIKNTAGVVNELKANIAFPTYEDIVLRKAQDFLDPSLKHHNNGKEL